MKFILLIFSTINGESFTNVTDSSRSPPNDTQSAFVKNETVTSTDVFKFNKFFYQKDLLIYLQNPNASIINKLALLDKYDGEFNTVSKFATNLVAGGLFTSWDMDMDMDMEFDLNKKKT